jgi:hypothetical protein
LTLFENPFSGIDCTSLLLVRQHSVVAHQIGIEREGDWGRER